MLGLLTIITFVGVMVVGQLSTTAVGMDISQSPVTNAVNSTMWSTLYNNTYAGFNLVIIIPIIIAAAALLAVAFYAVGKTV